MDQTWTKTWATGEAARSGPAGGAAAAGPPAPAKVTRQTERTARDDANLIQVLRDKKHREQLAAANAERESLQAENKELQAKNKELQAELECYRGNRVALKEYTDLALFNFIEEGFGLLTSCVAEHSDRIEVMVNEECKQKEQQDSEFLQILECPICCEVCQEAVAIRCGHTFCKKCAISSLQLKNECPVCKMPRVHSGETHPNWMLRDIISARSTMPKTDHKADRREKYAAEYAALRVRIDQKHAKLCAHMDATAQEALKRM